MSQADQPYAQLPGGSAWPPVDQPPPRRERQRFRSRGQMLGGALISLLIGLAVLALTPNEIALALRLEGTPGTLSISSCVRQPDGHAVDYRCVGDFHATKGTLNLAQVSYTADDNLTGRTIGIQRGPNGGYYTASWSAAAEWAGLTCFGLCLIGLFVMYLPSFSSRIDHEIRPHEQVRAGLLGPAQRLMVRIGSRGALLALLGCVLCEAAALILNVF